MRQSFSGRPRRICFPFVGDTLGGSHLSSIELFSELRKTGCDVVIVLHKSGRLEDELLRQEVDFNIVPVPRLIRHVPRYPTHWFQAVSTVIKLMSFCIRENIEVIHTNDGRIHVTWGIVAALPPNWVHDFLCCSNLCCGLTRMQTAEYWLTYVHFANTCRVKSPNS